MTRQALPPAWYQTIAETAAEFGTHSDRVLYCADAGLFTPAALVPKAALLPSVLPGPSPHVVVLLDTYGSMGWMPDGTDMVAPLLGEFRAYHVDHHRFTSLVIDGAGILVRRSALVVPLDQVEALRAAGEAARKSPRPDLVRHLHRALALYANEVHGPQEDPEKGHYTAGSWIATRLQLLGVPGSAETFARHIKAARLELRNAIDRATAEDEQPTIQESA